MKDLIKFKIISQYSAELGVLIDCIINNCDCRRSEVLREGNHICEVMADRFLKDYVMDPEDEMLIVPMMFRDLSIKEMSKIAPTIAKWVRGKVCCRKCYIKLRGIFDSEYLFMLDKVLKD